MKFKLIYLVVILFLFSSFDLFSRQRVDLVKEKDVYDLGYDISILEDPTNKLTIHDVIKNSYVRVVF